MTEDNDPFQEVCQGYRAKLGIVVDMSSPFKDCIKMNLPSTSHGLHIVPNNTFLLLGFGVFGNARMRGFLLKTISQLPLQLINFCGLL